MAFATDKVTVKFTLKQAGYCIASKHHALRGLKKENIRFYATFGHIEHPTFGHILFDTGYAKRFFTETKSFPESIYARATPVVLKTEEEAKNQLIEQGIDPFDVKYIIISHFHADHIAGLRDFPNAKFICSKEAWEDIKNRQGISALRRAFLPNLLPLNFIDRCQLITFQGSKISDPWLGDLYDLFGDGSIRLFECSGHAKGQIGALLSTSSTPILLVSDAAWLDENIINLHLPSPSVRLFFSSWSAYVSSLERIHKYYLNNPNVPIIPCHCNKTMDRYLNHIFL